MSLIPRKDVVRLVDAPEILRVNEPLGILVVDDFAPSRETLCRDFLDYESMVVVGEAADGEAACTSLESPQRMILS
jgi:hypothetical protein